MTVESPQQSMPDQQTGGDTDFDLEKYLGEINQNIDQFDKLYAGRVSTTGLITVYKGVVPVSPYFITKIVDSARKSGVVGYEKGGRNGVGIYFDRDTVLALGSACLVIERTIRETGEFNESWDEIVRRTRELLGEDNLIGLSLKYPDDSNRRYSLGDNSYQVFTQGRAKGAEKQVRGLEHDYERRELTPDEVDRELRSWNTERLKLLLNTVPDSIDSLDCLPSTREIPDYLVDHVMGVRDRMRGIDSTVRRVDVNSLEAIVFKNALRDVVGVMDILGQNGGEPNLLDLSSDVRRAEYA